MLKFLTKLGLLMLLFNSLIALNKSEVIEKETMKSNLIQKLIKLYKAKHEEGELPTQTWFVDQIFSLYTDTDEIGIADVEDIMTKLNIILDDHEQGKNFKSCYTGEEIFEIYEVKDKITKEEFIEMSSSLVWMGITQECTDHDHEHNHTEFCISDTEKYLFGSLTIGCIWLTSIISVVVLGNINKSKNYIVISLKALAIGTLLSDALLHIIPTTLGLHSHGDDEHDHDHDEEERSKNDPIWKMCVILGTIFVLWMLECFMDHHHAHDGEGHSHGHDHHDHSHNHHCEDKNKHNYDEISSGNSSPVSENRNDKNSIIFQNETVSIIEVKSNKTNKKNFLTYLRSVNANGWIAFFGDIMHKTADGLAIGAAFSESISLGFSTALAILFHEIPHELGDYAVLLSAGFTHCTILILNSITSASSLIGFFIIASLSPNETVREYIFAVIAGVFMYIALGNTIPRINAVFKKVNGKRDTKSIVLVVTFFFIGWIAMLLLALFEDDIQFDIGDAC